MPTRPRRGQDLAPTDTHSGKDISKRAAWVLGAEKVRREFREKRRRGKDDVGEDDTGRMSIKKRRKATEDNLPHTILVSMVLFIGHIFQYHWHFDYPAW